MIPSAAAFLAVGDVLAAMLFEHGAFTHQDTLYVWSILAGSTVGMLANTLGRLYSSAFYALKDTRTPLQFALIRVFLTTVLGWAFALWIPPWLGLDTHWGAAGLTASAGLAGWVEFLLLRWRLGKQIGPTGIPSGLVLRLWASAGLSAAGATALRQLTVDLNWWLASTLVLLSFAAVYAVSTLAMGVPEATRILDRIRRR